jgi:hypothetical protein
MCVTKCQGVKKDGQPCRYRAVCGDYCRIHSPKEVPEVPKAPKAPKAPEVPETPEAPEVEDCPICYEGILDSKDAKVTSCKHLFHRECLEKWTCEKSTCPMCRTIIAPTAPKRVRPVSVYIRPFSFTENGRTYQMRGSVFELADY